jgi:hypothetical protein
MPIRTMRTLDIKIEWMQFVRTRTRVIVRVRVARACP